MSQRQHVDVNGSVHTARKQYQRKHVCPPIASSVLCGLGLKKKRTNLEVSHWASLMCCSELVCLCRVCEENI